MIEDSIQEPPMNRRSDRSIVSISSIGDAVEFVEIDMMFSEFILG